jgi:hypothetical protein
MGGCTVKGVGENAFSQTWTEASNRLRADVTAVQQTRAGGGDTCHAGVWTHGKSGLSRIFHGVLINKTFESDPIQGDGLQAWTPQAVDSFLFYPYQEPA